VEEYLGALARGLRAEQREGYDPRGLGDGGEAPRLPHTRRHEAQRPDACTPPGPIPSQSRGRSRRKCVKHIHTKLHRAVRRALVTRNVAAAVDPPKARTPEMRLLSSTQARTLLDAANGNMLEALYVLAVTTGMRQGEILGIRWEDVDLEAGTVRVRRTQTLAKGGPRLTDPKTRGAVVR
jgi:integrase